jgi:acetyl-CoA acyltransferase
MKEALIVSAVRSGGGNSRRGGLRFTRPDDLAAQVIQGALARVPSLKPELIEDYVLGCAFPEGEQGLNVARLVALKAGIGLKEPGRYGVPGQVVNRFCSSGLQAVAIAAMNIMCGWNDVMLAGGLECMSRVPMGGFVRRPNPVWAETYPEPYVSMGITAEIVAAKYNVTRQMQDELAVRSNKRSADAQKNGWFTEIVPVQAGKYTKKDGKGVKETYTFSADDGVRPETTVEILAKLPTVFKQGGTVTAGNSSQTTDGTAAVILMSREKCDELGIKPLAKFHNFQTVGVPPEEMGVGPRWAIPKLLDKVGKKVSDIDLFEVNEAFASQALYSVRELGIKDDKFNICGGAIALGHPLGCTGAKLTATIIAQLKRLGKKWGVVSMCIGGGMGAAGLIEVLD